MIVAIADQNVDHDPANRLKHVCAPIGTEAGDHVDYRFGIAQGIFALAPHTQDLTGVLDMDSAVAFGSIEAAYRQGIFADQKLLGHIFDVAHRNQFVLSDVLAETAGQA